MGKVNTSHILSFLKSQKNFEFIYNESKKYILFYQGYYVKYRFGVQQRNFF